MSIVVVQPDTDHTDRRVRRCEERRIGVRRTVVRNLEHIRTQVDPGGEQSLLGLDLRVAGQQNAYPVDLGAQHERRVVRVGAGVVKRRGRTQHVELHCADPEVGSDRWAEQRQAAWPDDLVDDRHTAARVGERAHENAR